MNDLLGVRIVCPLFLNVIPSILLRPFELDTFCASSSKVCSPSPLTNMSTAFSSLRTCSSINVACGPPRTTIASGHASFATCADRSADCIVGVIEVMPIKFGSIDANFAFNSSWFISSAGQSITVTSCPFSSRTAARYAKPVDR